LALDQKDFFMRMNWQNSPGKTPESTSSAIITSGLKMLTWAHAESLSNETKTENPA